MPDGITSNPVPFPTLADIQARKDLRRRSVPKAGKSREKSNGSVGAGVAGRKLKTFPSGGSL